MNRALKAWVGHWMVPLALAAQAMTEGGRILVDDSLGRVRETGWHPEVGLWALPLSFVLGWRLRELTASEGMALVPGHARTHTLLLGLVWLPLAIALTALPYLVQGAAPLPTWAMAVSLVTLLNCATTGRWVVCSLLLVIPVSNLLRLEGRAGFYADIGLVMATPLFTALVLRDIACRPHRERSRLWLLFEQVLEPWFDRLIGFWQPPTNSTRDRDPVRRAWRQGFAQSGGWRGLWLGSLIIAAFVSAPAWFTPRPIAEGVAAAWVVVLLIACAQAHSWAHVIDRKNALAPSKWNPALAAQLRLLPGTRRTTAALAVAGGTAYGLTSSASMALGTLVGLVPPTLAGHAWHGPALYLLLPATVLGGLALGALPALTMTCRSWIGARACVWLAVLLVLLPPMLCTQGVAGATTAMLLLMAAAVVLPPLARRRLSAAELP